MVALTYVINIERRRTKTVTLRVDQELNDMLERAVKDLGYRSKSDYMRVALMEFLAEFERVHEIKESSRISGEQKGPIIIYV